MKTLLVLVLLISNLNIFSQDIQSYILNHAEEIKSIDADDTDFSDLVPLKTAIGEARVVMLGEQSHGDATTFEAKTRIVKMLHEEMDFDVLVFESDFYALNQCNFKKDSLGFEILKENIYNVWTQCSSMQDLFGYCRNNDSLVVTGCDSRHSGSYSKANYLKDLEVLMKKNKMPFLQNGYETFRPVLEEIIKNEYFSKATEKEKELFFAGVDTLKMQLAKIDFGENKFWLQELDNLKIHALFAWKNPPSVKNMSDERDEQMGENLIWLAKEMFPDKKIIFWAHNVHVMKNPEDDKRNYAGDVFVQRSGIPSYVIGFDSYQGKFTFAVSMADKGTVIKKTKKNSIETWLKETGFSNAFVDLKGFNGKSEPFFMRNNGNYQQECNWQNAYDGIFYIETMKGCE